MSDKESKGAMPSRAGGCGPMPLGAFVKEEEVAQPMTPGACFKEEDVPSMPLVAAVKEEHEVVLKVEERSYDRRKMRRKK